MEDLGSDDGDLTEVETKALVSTYRVFGPLEKAAKTCKEKVRNELENRIGEGTEDAKGNVHFRSPIAHLEFRPRVKMTFQPEAAKALLEARDLYDLCVDTEYVVKDPAKLSDMLDEVQEQLLRLGEDQLAHRIEAMKKDVVEERKTLSEKKIEALVKKGKIPLSEVDQMYESKTSYALYDVTKSP